MSDKLTICVCGGGNGAHVLSGLSASRKNTEVRVLTLFADEAERWTNALKSSDFTVLWTNKDGSKSEIKAKPKIVTKKPEEAIKGADQIIFTVPAFAHEEYFTAIAPFVEKGAVIAGIPGQPGFEFQCRDILGKKADECHIMCFETLPWACRIVEYGKKVDVLGVKTVLAGSLLSGHVAARKPPLATLQYLYGAEPVFRQAKHFLEILIMGYSFVHLAILHGHWKNWDGKPVEKEPLFYQGIDQAAADMLSACSKECLDVAKAIMKSNPGVDLSDVKDIYDWYMEYYKDDIEDSTNLFTAIRTNKSYKGLVHPMTKVDGGFEPNFSNRYLTEDLPMGMIVFRGVADAAGVKIPNNDKLIEWGQKLMKKEFLVDGKLTGKDVKTTRCPQKYGFTTLDGVISGKK